MDMDPFTGMRKEEFRLPQYLMKAILGCEMDVAVKIDMLIS